MLPRKCHIGLWARVVRDRVCREISAPATTFAMLVEQELGIDPMKKPTLEGVQRARWNDGFDGRDLQELIDLRCENEI
jgi:hypothetical protein